MCGVAVEEAPKGEKLNLVTQVASMREPMKGQKRRIDAGDDDGGRR